MGPRDPCLIGWAQLSRFPGEPLEAWAEALRRTGVAPSAIDTLDVVYCQSWQYDDPAGRLAAAVGAAPRRTRYSGIGGTVPLTLAAEAARRILAGEADVCAVVGGEALATVRQLKKAGQKPAWSHRDPERKPFPFEAPFHPSEVAHQLFQAYSTFALRDIARRGHLGISPADHQRSLGELFAPMTKVAASNPNAWFPVERSADELATPSADNRFVAFPYPKLLVAVMDVDLAGAVVLASREAADRLGVADDRRVYLRGWGYATDAVYVAEHDEPWRSPGMAAAAGMALGAAGAGIHDVAHLDLYACFPSAVSFALDALGLQAGDERAPFTVTGGLPYAGGAGSCYALSSMAAMADVLTADPGSLGMTTGVGMHLTKHAAVVWSSVPPATTVEPPPPDPGPAVLRPIVDIHDGPATVTGYTVHHGREGGPTDAVLVCELDGGARCYGRSEDPAMLAALEAEEWVGRTVRVSAGAGGVNAVAAA